MHLFLDGWLTDKKYKDVGGVIKRTGRQGDKGKGGGIRYSKAFINQNNLL